MNIRELLIRIGVSGAGQAGREVDNLDHKVGSLKDSFGNLGGIIAGAFSLLSIGAIAHAADEMQTLEFRVGQMAQTTGSASDAFDEVARHATDGRISIEAYTEAYAGIGAATHDLVHDQEDLLNITDSVAQGLSLAGANTQQTTSVMQQLTQAVAVGKLQWEDLRVILENSDAFAVRLSKSLGMSLSEMIKATQGQGGGIGADKIIDALRGMNAEVTKTFKEMPLTISQATTIVTNRFDMMVARFNRSSGAVTYVANLFVSAMDYIQSGVEWLTDALGGAENAVRILGVALGAAGLVGSVAALSAALGVLMSPIGLLIAGLTAAYLIGEDFYQWLKGGPSLFGDLVGPASEYTDQINGMAGAMRDLRDIAVALLNALNGLADFFNSGQDMAQSWGDKLGTTKVGPWIKEKLGAFGADVGQWGEWLNYQTNGAFDIPKMFGDSMAGLRDYNAEQSEGRKNATALNSAYSDMPVTNAIPAFGAPQAPNVSIHIGSISVDGSSDAPADIRKAAETGVSDAFGQSVGWRPGSTLGDTLSFASGGK